MKNFIKDLVNKLPYVKNLYLQTMEFNKNSCFPAGHFYSPIVSVDDIKNRERDIWNDKQTDHLLSIDLNVTGQVELLEILSGYYKEMQFTSNKEESRRYYFENDFYSYTDGIILYCMMRHYKPKRIIEVGSGFSSALMMDVNAEYFNNSIHLTFIEPYAERLFSLLDNKDKQNVLILEDSVQKVELEYFKKLERGDFLFIDSTHVSKTGSDVNHILFQILPVLQEGVIIHFHDIFYPFEYPKNWVMMGRNWNEDYILRAFLSYNNQFEIKVFSHYLHLHHSNVFSEMPLTYKNFGGNLWIEKQNLQLAFQKTFN